MRPISSSPTQRLRPLQDGELKFTVPAGWSARKRIVRGRPVIPPLAGPVGSIGSVTFSGASLNVPIYSLTTGETSLLTTDEGKMAVLSFPHRVGRLVRSTLKIKGSEGGSLVNLYLQSTYKWWSDRRQVVEAPPQSTQMATCTPVIPDAKSQSPTLLSVKSWAGSSKLPCLMAMTGRMRRLQASLSPLVMTGAVSTAAV